MGTARGQGLAAYSAQLQTGLALCLECKRCGGIKSPGIVLTCIGISPLLVRWDRSQEKSLPSPHPPARGPRNHSGPVWEPWTLCGWPEASARWKKGERAKVKPQGAVDPRYMKPGPQITTDSRQPPSYTHSTFWIPIYSQLGLL